MRHFVHDLFNIKSGYIILSSDRQCLTLAPQWKYWTVVDENYEQFLAEQGWVEVDMPSDINFSYRDNPTTYAAHYAHYVGSGSSYIEAMQSLYRQIADEIAKHHAINNKLAIFMCERDI